MDKVSVCYPRPIQYTVSHFILKYSHCREGDVEPSPNLNVLLDTSVKMTSQISATVLLGYTGCATYRLRGPCWIFQDFINIITWGRQLWRAVSSQATLDDAIALPFELAQFFLGPLLIQDALQNRTFNNPASSARSTLSCHPYSHH